MLSKDICIQCHKSQGARWHKEDEVDWDMGTVACPMHNETSGGKLYAFNSVSAVPEDCRFAVEQVVAGA
jgi:hypothetical protein